MSCRVLAVLALLPALAAADTLTRDPAKIKIQPKVMKAWAFDLQRVRLLPGPFQRAMEANAKYMLSIDTDRLLSRYRTFSGLEPKAPEYKGWESATISGHTLGHYLSAIAMQYASTGDKRFLDRINYILDELALAQRTKATGFVGGFPNADRLWKELTAGIIKTQAFDLNGIWVPWYTTHKLMTGLIDVYTLNNDARAKDILIKLTDFTIDLTDKLTDEQMQQMMATEHGGVLESYTDVYAITGDPKYLRLAERWYHKRFLDPLAERRDVLTGLHINTNIPKVLGASRLYEVTGGEKWRTISEFFWEKVVRERTYVIGGYGDDEYFFPPDRFRDHVSSHTAETCNTYNMLKLTRHMFAWAPTVEQGDFYERALYNHILASIELQNAGTIYLCSLKPGHFKVFGTAFDSFWCCTGTGMENHAKYNESIYFYNDDGLYVNLFLPSELDWKEKGLKLRQQTRFPVDGVTRLTFETARPVNTAIRVRHPRWAEAALKISVNGRVQNIASKPGEFAVITRQWKTGDTLEVVLPMRLRMETLPGAPDRVAVLYGPIVLAGAMGKEGIQPPMIARERLAYDMIPTPDTPVIVADDRDPQKWFRKAAGKPLTFTAARTGLFRTASAAKTDGMELRPFYDIDERYAVYWQAFTTAEWTRKETTFREEERRRKLLEARLTDDFRPGEMQPEREHNVKSERSTPGEIDLRKMRDAQRNGWFSFEMTVDPGRPMELVCSYWGGQANRTFDVLVDNVKIATQTLNQDKPGEPFDVIYALPEEQTRGKQKVTVKLQAGQQQGRGAGAGPLLRAMTLRKQ